MTIHVKRAMAVERALALSLIFLAIGSAQDTGTDQTRNISLIVPAGVPLRLYLTKRVAKRSNAPVEARLLAPVYAFDHEVIPAGTLVLGHVSHVRPVARWDRVRAVLGGDFSPLHVAQIEFTSLVLADGRSMELHTIESPGLNSLFPSKPPKQRTPRANRKPGIRLTPRSRASRVSPTSCADRGKRSGSTTTRCPGSPTTRNRCGAGPVSMRNSSLRSVLGRRRSLRTLWLY